MRIGFHQYAQHDPSQSWEWLDGALELLPPPSLQQRRLQAYLLDAMSAFAEDNQFGLVIPGPFAVRLPEEMQRGREPDLLFVPNAFVETIQEHYVNSHGVTIVVEVADARSRYRDHVDKFHDYEAAGIPEYWIIDADESRASFYTLQPDNQYAEVAPDHGVYHSHLLKGFALDLSELWRRGAEA
jgi:Uma2 family endonuclease